jgi:hypothetical protein
LQQALGGISNYQGLPGFQPLHGLEFGTNLAQNQYGGPSAALGYSTLAQLLGQQGRIDPRAGNEVVAGIQRGTQTGQQNTQGELARRGLGGSGVGQALAAAQGQAGQNQIASFRADEAQQAEARKRQDLQLLMQMVIDPAFDHQELRTNWELGQQQIKQQNRASRRATYAAYAEALASMVGGMAGGGG